MSAVEPLLIGSEASHILSKQSKNYMQMCQKCPLDTFV